VLFSSRPAAVGFPVIILMLIPLRALVVPRMTFSPEELGILDRPTASPFVRVVLFCFARAQFDVNCLLDHAIS
jgi:hypothetical protein